MSILKYFFSVGKELHESILTLAILWSILYVIS